MTADGRAVADLVGEMTLAEKLGQMTQVSNDSITPAEVAEFAVGSVLSGGDGNPTPNTPSVWRDMVDEYTTAARDSRLGTPLLYGVDAVHGHSNVAGATIFPHNIGLGAIDDPDLVVRIGRATALEMRATGIRWAFAPTVAVPQDIRWGRTYEGYSRDPDVVSRLGSALVAGLRGTGEPVDVLACAKHFVADGATAWGSVPRPDWITWWDGWGDGWQIDQGDARIDETTLRAVHLAPYRAAISAGVGSVMASYSSWNGIKLHGHRYLLTDVLKGELGFGGFVVSDWMAIDQLADSYLECVTLAINAGIDMVMVPIEFRRFLDTATQAVADGWIPMARIDDAVTRILRAKAGLGLFAEEDAPPALSTVGDPEHRKLAAGAARRSAVLLKNDGGLPIRNHAAIGVAGIGSDDIGLQCGGWSVGWQGGAGDRTGGTTLLEALRAAHEGAIEYRPDGSFDSFQSFDVGIACVAEEPYAEGPGDREMPTLRTADLDAMERLRLQCDVLIAVIYSGRPLPVPQVLEKADVVIAAWWPGTEMTEFPQLLLGRDAFEGRLPQPWPAEVADLDDPEAIPAYPLGYGAQLGPIGGST